MCQHHRYVANIIVVEQGEVLNQSRRNTKINECVLHKLIHQKVVIFFIPHYSKFDNNREKQYK